MLPPICYVLSVGSNQELSNREFVKAAAANMGSPVTALLCLAFWLCGPTVAIRVPVSYDDTRKWNLSSCLSRSQSNDHETCCLLERLLCCFEGTYFSHFWVKKWRQQAFQIVSYDVPDLTASLHRKQSSSGCHFF
jgi:hypothetical protein